MVTNRNSRNQQLRFRYLSDSGTVFTSTRTLGAYATLMLEDLVTGMFGAGDGRGPLEIKVLTDNTLPPVVVSRAFAQNPFGNLGSGLPADVEMSTDTVSMPGLFHDSQFRSNVSVTAGEREVWATFDLYRGDDGLVASGVQRRIAAGTQEQWSVEQLFRGQAAEGVPMTVRVTPSAPALIFASLVDNASTDSAVALGKQPSVSWVIPVAAHLPGAEGTFWSSSLSMWNSTARTAWVDLEYLPEKTDNSGGGLRTGYIRLDPGATRTLEDVLYDRFGIEDGKGVLVMEATYPITVTSRVFTGGPQGGSSGNGVRSVTSQALRPGEMVLPGVRVADGFRTNIGLVTGDRWVRFDLELRNGDGSRLASRTLDVPPRTVRQWSVQQLFSSGYRDPDPVGAVLVSANDDALAYMTIIDGTSQDPVFVMPQ
jgi:hypothetical protein